MRICKRRAIRAKVKSEVQKYRLQLVFFFFFRKDYFLEPLMIMISSFVCGEKYTKYLLKNNLDRSQFSF